MHVFLHHIIPRTHISIHIILYSINISLVSHIVRVYTNAGRIVQRPSALQHYPKATPLKTHHVTVLEHAPFASLSEIMRPPVDSVRKTISPCAVCGEAMLSKRSCLSMTSFARCEALVSCLSFNLLLSLLPSICPATTMRATP